MGKAFSRGIIEGDGFVPSTGKDDALLAGVKAPLTRKPRQAKGFVIVYLALKIADGNRDRLAVRAEVLASRNLSQSRAAFPRVLFETENRGNQMIPELALSLGPFTMARTALDRALKGLPSLLEIGRKAIKPDLVANARTAAAPTNLPNDQTSTAPFGLTSNYISEHFSDGSRRNSRQ